MQEVVPRGPHRQKSQLKLKNLSNSKLYVLSGRVMRFAWCDFAVARFLCSNDIPPVLAPAIIYTKRQNIASEESA